MRLSGALDLVPAPAIAIFAITLIQLGQAAAKTAFGLVDVLPLIFMRLLLSSIILFPFCYGVLPNLTRSQWFDAILLGVIYAFFSLCFFSALEVLPLGILAAIGFLGPLCVSFIGVQTFGAALWPVLGFFGVLLFVPNDEASTQSLTHIGMGLLFALSWAAYILGSARAGRNLPGLSGFALAHLVAVVLMAPFGAREALTALTSVDIVLLVCMVAGLSLTGLALEFEALRRLPVKLFGVLLALEPAIAALIGFALLHELLGVQEIIALVTVSIAAMGASLTHARKGLKK